MSKEQDKTFYYYEYCMGNGVDDIPNYDWETCSQCGDISSRLVFDFSSKEDFVQKYVSIYTLVHYQDDDETLTELELIEKLGKDYYYEELKWAGERYDELMRRELE